MPAQRARATNSKDDPGRSSTVAGIFRALTSSHRSWRGRCRHHR